MQATLAERKRLDAAYSHAGSFPGWMVPDRSRHEVSPYGSFGFASASHSADGRVGIGKRSCAERVRKCVFWQKFQIGESLAALLLGLPTQSCQRLTNLELLPEYAFSY